jgi:hypothetical protein
MFEYPNFFSVILVIFQTVELYRGDNLCSKSGAVYNNNIFLTLNIFVCLMVFNATFNNISVILWQSVLLVEETGVPGEIHQPAASRWQSLSNDVASSKVLLKHYFSYLHELNQLHCSNKYENLP